jgi:hypothetical protein
LPKGRVNCLGLHPRITTRFHSSCLMVPRWSMMTSASSGNGGQTCSSSTRSASIVRTLFMERAVRTFHSQRLNMSLAMSRYRTGDPLELRRFMIGISSLRLVQGRNTDLRGMPDAYPPQSG